MKHKLIFGESLEVMRDIPDGSIDMVLTDPPYGTTACKWDVIIPFEPMWEQLHRIIKPNGAIVLFGSEPFSSLLITSNISLFKYSMTWVKERPSNPALAKKRPLNYTENIIVFYKKFGIFNPQYGKREEKNKRNNANEKFNTETSAKLGDSFNKTGLNNFLYPKNYVYVNVQRGIHPTQKPVALMEYLIKTYTNENDTILDFTCGSGTTNVAAKNLKRNSIGIDNWFCKKSKIINGIQIKGLKWIEIAQLRLDDKI